MNANRIGASGISFDGDFIAHMQLMARKKMRRMKMLWCQQMEIIEDELKHFWRLICDLKLKIC